MMIKRGTTLTSGRYIPILFHLVFWTLWFGLPLATFGDNEKFRNFSLWMIPVNLTLIPMFLLNTEWLIPNLLRKNKTTLYLFALLLLGTLFTLVQYLMREWIVPKELGFNRHNIYFTATKILFILAVSTGYAFIRFTVQEENNKQEEKAERLKSELSFLRSQISPHFIFNVLNSIVYLIRSKSEMAEPVTLKLSELMRYMLYTPPEGQVPLFQEIDYLQNYIDLQRIRFEEDVDVTYQLSGSPNGQLIEPMILIPFVENAFKHGVGMLNEPQIQIDLHIKDAELIFSVQNKVAPESIEDKDGQSGIGIPNVKRRLELLYPGTHHLDIQQRDEYYIIHLSLQLSLGKEKAQETRESIPRYETAMHNP